MAIAYTYRDAADTYWVNHWTSSSSRSETQASTAATQSTNRVTTASSVDGGTGSAGFSALTSANITNTDAGANSSSGSTRVATSGTADYRTTGSTASGTTNSTGGITDNGAALTPTTAGVPTSTNTATSTAVTYTDVGFGNTTTSTSTFYTLVFFPTTSVSVSQGTYYGTAPAGDPAKPGTETTTLASTYLGGIFRGARVTVSNNDNAPAGLGATTGDATVNWRVTANTFGALDAIAASQTAATDGATETGFWATTQYALKTSAVDLTNAFGGWPTSTFSLPLSFGTATSTITNGDGQTTTYREFSTVQQTFSGASHTYTAPYSITLTQSVLHVGESSIAGSGLETGGGDFRRASTRTGATLTTRVATFAGTYDAGGFTTTFNSGTSGGANSTRGITCAAGGASTFRLGLALTADPFGGDDATCVLPWARPGVLEIGGDTTAAIYFGLSETRDSAAPNYSLSLSDFPRPLHSGYLPGFSAMDTVCRKFDRSTLGGSLSFLPTSDAARISRFSWLKPGSNGTSKTTWTYSFSLISSAGGTDRFRTVTTDGSAAGWAFTTDRTIYLPPGAFTTSDQSGSSAGCSSVPWSTWFASSRSFGYSTASGYSARSFSAVATAIEAPRIALVARFGQGGRQIW